MFTPTQTAKMLGIATSTLRKYSRLYKEHLTESARRRRRVYTDPDIATLARVIQLREEGVPLVDIAGMLGAIEHVPEDSLKMIPHIAQEFENIHSDIAGVQARIDALEELERERKERQTRPWWRKLLG